MCTSNGTPRLIIPTIPGNYFVYPRLASGLGAFGNPITSLSEGDWSRREELNTPSPDWYSVALTLSYTGEFLVL